MTDCNKVIKDIEYAKDLLQNRPEQDTVDYKVWEVLDDALDPIHDLRGYMPTVLTSIRLPKDFRDSLSEEAERENRTLSNLITTKLLEHDRMEYTLNYFKTILNVNDIMMLYDMIMDGKAKIVQEKEEHERTITITTKIKFD